EPTTGLDSHHAYDMMMMLKLYTEKERKTVVVTIHQPSSQIFHMFDRLLLLSGGHVAYFGESNKILNYFSNLGLHCTPHYNPADFILEAVSTDEEVHERIINSYLEMRESMEEFGLTQLDEIDLDDTESVIDMNFMNNTSNNLVMTRCDQEPVRSMMTHRPAHGSTQTKRQHHLHSIKKWYEDYYDEKWPTCFWTQYTVLNKRDFIQAKNKILSKWAAIQVVSVAIMAGLVWFQIERTEERLTDRKGILFFTIIYWMVTPMMATLSAFPEEREVLNKERSAGVYRLSAYYLAKLTSELPLAVTLPTLYLII
ncbi:PREDICTED: ABC transporter G family member 22-like, partial [Priapulus caudatus]|uniref:ABC transporter G family member 22-like n=1 Tax=Priapulus caudatus TaxID=37621 RepID=A0ABM1ESK4_PRICU